MKIRRGSVNACLAWLLIGIYIAGGSLWSWYAPSCIDDYTYDKVPVEYTRESFDRCDGRPVKTISDSFDAIGHVMVVDNGRLANFVHILFSPFDPVVERVANCVALALMTLLMCVLAGKNNRITPGATALTLAGLWIVLPWYDGMQALVFQTNYVWASALLCAGWLLWSRRERLTGTALTATALLMLILGWWHEGFAVAILAYMIADMAFNPKPSRRRSLLLIAAAATGLVCNLGFGTVTRMATHGTLNGNAGHFGELLTGIIFDIWPVFLAIVLAAVAIIRAGNERSVLIRHLAPWFVSMIVLLAMSFVLQMYGRTFWPALLVAILINVWMSRRMFHIPATALAAVLIAFAALSVWWFFQLVTIERKVRLAYDGFVAQLTSYREEGRRSNVVYGALGGSDAIPWYLFGIPDTFEENPEGAKYLANNFGYYNNVIVMLPDSLRGRSFDQLPEYEGNTRLRGVWPVLLAPDSASTGVLHATVCEPGTEMNPVNKLLALCSGDAHEVTYPLAAWRFPVTMPDGQEVFVSYIVKRPRTKRYRTVLRLDSGF